MDTDAAWAPVLDPEWSRTFGRLETRLRDWSDMEGCPCAACVRQSPVTKRNVVFAWMSLDDADQARWWETQGMTPTAAALRDVLVTVNDLPGAQAAWRAARTTS